MRSAKSAAADPDEHSTLRDRVADTVRQADHVAQEAQQLKTIATDAVEDGVRAVKRGVKRSVHDIEDARETAVYRIKRAPFKAVAVAACGGLVFGAVLVGWAALLMRGSGATERASRG